MKMATKTDRARLMALNQPLVLRTANECFPPYLHNGVAVL